MITKHIPGFLVAGLTLAALSISSNANAITLPDTSSCINTDPCFTIRNTGGGTAINGFINTASSSSAAVVGRSDSSTGGAVGVWGEAFGSGPGVRGQSFGAGSGVEGYTEGAFQSGVYGQAVHTSGGYGIYGAAYSSGGFGVYGYNSNASGWAVYSSGKLFASSGYKPGGGMWSDSSDRRLKKDVKPLEGALERLLKLQGVTFEWIEPEKHGNLTGRQTGLIAQDVEKVFPEWVGTDAQGYKTVTVRGLEALSVEALRTLRGENDRLRSQLANMEDRVKKLENTRPVMVAGFSGSSLGMVGAIALAIGMLLRFRLRGA